MNDNDIIKALECCVGKSLKRYLCLKCPLRDRDCYGGALLMPEVLELINRQKAEIERLYKTLNAVQCEQYTNGRNDGIKEFAERLKAIYGEWLYDYRIDDLVKEMTEECNDEL